MIEKNNWELRPTKNPMAWKDGEPINILNSWYLVWYQPPWQFGYFNALKSNKEKLHSLELKNQFINLLKWRIDLLKKSGHNPVVVLPPRKSTWNQTMEFVVDALGDILFIKIKSPDYRGIHFLKNKEEREQTIQRIFPKWKIKFDASLLDLEKLHYIFIDDYFTTGITTQYVFKAIQENKRLPKPSLEKNEFNNFEALYISRTQNKRNVKSKNMWIVDPTLSVSINKYAKKTKFEDSKRDSGFYKNI